MLSIYKRFHLKFLYIFFVFLSLTIYFFSTSKSYSKGFDIDNIEISEPFEINFNKNQVIDEGFKKAFSELVLLILNSSDQIKVEQVKLSEIKAMIETFSIKEEKFINETYYLNLGVSFNKKKIFKYLESKNIFPSIPLKKKILFIPIIIDENKRELLVFSRNKIFSEWNNNDSSYHLIEYILPTEDLEDLSLLKKKYEFIENYDFKEIISKYDLEDSIIALIFKNERDVRILSKININDDMILKNQSFTNMDLNNSLQIESITNNLKMIYEDYWKKLNQINTSIKLPINIRVKSSDNKKILNFENILYNDDLIYDFSIIKFDKDYVYYQVIFNGTPNNFLKSMNENKLDFNTQNLIWILK